MCKTSCFLTFNEFILFIYWTSELNARIHLPAETTTTIVLCPLEVQS